MKVGLQLSPCGSCDPQSLSLPRQPPWGWIEQQRPYPTFCPWPRAPPGALAPAVPRGRTFHDTSLLCEVYERGCSYDPTMLTPSSPKKPNFNYARRTRCTQMRPSPLAGRGTARPFMPPLSPRGPAPCPTRSTSSCPRPTSAWCSETRSTSSVVLVVDF